MDYRIKEIIDNIQADIKRFPRALIAARTLNISVSRFQHLFKQEMSVSFAQYLKKKRLEKAKKLLIETDLSIKQVAFEIGVGNETNFIRTFKQAFRETPGEYRKNHSENIVNK